MSEDQPIYKVQHTPQSDGPKIGRTANLPSRVFLDPKINPAAIRVLGLLASVVKRNGHCYAQVGWLANRLGVTERSVRRHLSILRATGYIASEPLFHEDTGRRSHNRYRVLLSDRAEGPENHA